MKLKHFVFNLWYKLQIKIIHFRKYLLDLEFQDCTSKKIMTVQEYMRRFLILDEIETKIKNKMLKNLFQRLMK